MAPYQYTALNEAAKEIRLMTLLAGAFCDDIHIVLNTRPFPADGTSQVPKFEALSYTWGSLDDPVNIIVHDGASQFGTLAVTRNLATALPYLRHKVNDRVLWVDAVCVSQRDLAERSSQVQKMADIYSRAELVIAWLGPENETSTHALELINSLGSRITVDWLSQAMEPATGEHRDWTDQSKPLPYTQEECSAISSLFCRSWFERLWIRQEIQLATNAVLACGFSIIPWSSFRNAVFCLYRKPKLEGIIGLPERIEFMEELADYGGSYQSLGLMIYQARYCKCSDPKDRVYAMLSLLHDYDKERWTIKPEYTRMTCQVYEDTSFSYMEAFGDLGLLRQCDLGNRDSKQDLPTWVPNWASMESVALPLPMGMADCSSPGCYKRSKREGNGVLHAKGLHVGLIKEVTDLHIFDDHVPRYEDALELQRVAICNNLTGTYAGGGVLQDALCRTFRLNIFQERWDPPVSTQISEQEGRTTFPQLLECTPESFADDLIRDGKFHGYLKSVIKFWKGRSFITTEDGYIGLAPKATRPGDRVCVLLGCNSPLVIRPVGADSAQYQVVGESYMDSFMTAEAILGPLPDHYRHLEKFDAEEGAHKSAFFDSRTSKTQPEDPRWELLLGEDYEERLKLKGMTGADEKTLMLTEVLKAREIELEWLEFI